MSGSASLAEIAEWVGGEVRGDASIRVTSLRGLEDAGSEDLTWLAREKLAHRLADCRAAAVLLPKTFGDAPLPAVLCDNVSAALIVVLKHFAPPVPRPEAGVHPEAVVAPSAVMGDQVAVGAHVVVGERVRIGEGTVLHAGVSISDDVVIGRHCELWQGVVIRERCQLGDRVVIHPNTVVGADGFGYEFIEGQHRKIPQIGTVEIADDVEIGANCAIDRAKLGATRIGEGTKIDNLVQVAHNVQIGPRCMIVSQVGIGGSSRLGEGVTLAGKAGVGDNVTLEDGVVVGGFSGVAKDVKAGTFMFGIPAIEKKAFAAERGRIRRIPKLIDRIDELLRRVERLEAAKDDT
jgi:UDP-3-O-[3-hydroxymyristoyl] glucosamine N-acyltransferase